MHQKTKSIILVVANGAITARKPNTQGKDRKRNFRAFKANQSNTGQSQLKIKCYNCGKAGHKQNVFRTGPKDQGANKGCQVQSKHHFKEKKWRNFLQKSKEEMIVFYPTPGQKSHI